jgi:hypothetical protein
MILRMELSLEDIKRIINAVDAFDYFDISDHLIDSLKELEKIEKRYDEVKAYGYDWDGMYFFSYDEAYSLYLDSDLVLYKCYPDGTESEVEEYDEIEKGYWYGVEKEKYKIEVKID